MSTRTPAGRTAKGASAGKDRAATVPFWKRDLSSMLQRRPAEEPDVDGHPPFTPGLPAVDLLPDDVRASIAAAHVRRRLYLAATLLVLAAAVIWFLQAGQISQAQADLEAEQQRSIELTARTQALAPVQQLNAEIAAQREFVQTTLASQPLVASTATALLGSAEESGVDDLTATSLTFHGIPGPGGDLNPCPTSDPFSSDVTIGCLTFSASAPSRAEVAAMLAAMAANPLFVGPYVSSTTVSEGEDGIAVGFTGTAGISTSALVTPLTEEQLAALTAPPEPTPSPSAEAGE